MSIVWHMVGQLIRVRDEWDWAHKNNDQEVVKIMQDKIRHYTKAVYIYLRTGMRPNENENEK